MAESKAFRPNDCTCFKEAVCIDAERIYDSCSDKDCLEDLQVFFSDKTQPIIDKAASIKCKKVKVINVCVDVESVPFNKGFYSVDMTFYFLVELSAYLSPGTPAVNCCGISYFSKKVILYGSEANARVFSSHSGCCSNNEQMTAMPNQADTTGEFMFGIMMGYEIKNGKLGRAVRDTTISGFAFQMLQTVDMLSDDMVWSCSGTCGKKQPMPVGMGGPAVKCKVNVAGK